ncbi:DNA repair protein RecN (Recombination protein N) [Peptoniphilus asaccharolyticus DSM 20463]|uniref:DNA repair protein RecN n=1 Tax=Peptoniphilus asaccharolyticus DSM 20463 TaxID=573058 RepID=A0A1W1UMU3_PEPAS|nr:DNA repair protein RecN [Peptoniphilus asaccharolyticus]MBL7574943.1 DNA repair protein RecN [Peptoniphilus asaccharolyticus]SMB82458.1 DNA repair protein RecN (Recombination protein N) [Peptoniphilus asaccharolyticus DSM 20463]
MLLELSIKNFAIIEDLRVEFGKGLNVLTGETGSGKSIIIDALSMVLGQRTNKDVIKKGKDYAYIEAIFTCYDSFDEIEELDFEAGELIIISKEIKLDRPAISKINGRTVNNSTVMKLTSKLIDIFAQHESVSLMANENQREMLDIFAGKEQRNLIEAYTEEFEKLKKLQSELKEKSSLENDREREIDLLKYQVQEIEDANLTQYDDEELEEDFKKLDNSTDIIKELSKATLILKNYDEGSVEQLIDEVVSSLAYVYKFDSAIEEEYRESEDLRYRLRDLAANLESYTQRIELDPERFSYLESRLNLVNSLKKKYGRTVDDINKFFVEINDRLEFLENFEKNLQKLELEISKVEKKARELAVLISANRKKATKLLESKVRDELIELSIKNAEFRVDFNEKELSKDGIDRLEFMIKTNLGEDFKPLAKTASGGEMSRIMLGFKSILAQRDNIQTLIFDEIDTGISGKTAMLVGKKIKNLSKDRQIIAISHLQQIVSLADHHYLIEKTSSELNTISTVRKLNREERVNELARLIGGMEITDTAIDAARELISKGEING